LAASRLGAGAIVTGRPETRYTTPVVNAYIAAHGPGHVIIVNPDAGALGRPTLDGVPQRLASQRGSPDLIETAVTASLASRLAPSLSRGSHQAVA
jgi:hypothetical protein